MTPLIDLMNHRPSSLMQFRVAPSGEIEVINFGPDLEANTPALINYGVKGNGELLKRYGFVFSNNPADVYPLKIGEKTCLLFRPNVHNAEVKKN